MVGMVTSCGRSGRARRREVWPTTTGSLVKFGRSRGRSGRTYAMCGRFGRPNLGGGHRPEARTTPPRMDVRGLGKVADSMQSAPQISIFRHVAEPVHDGYLYVNLQQGPTSVRSDSRHGSEGSGDGGGRAPCPRPPTYPAIGYLRFASGHDACGGSSGISEATASGPSLRRA